MKGDTKVIQYLNQVLKNELTAINQYFLHARMLDDWGVTKLGAKEYQESIEEMNHADKLIQRILFLEGLPNLQDLGKLMIGESVKEVLECDLKVEYNACPELREAVQYCEQVGDYPSRDLFREILREEEEHIDYLETQLHLMEKIGEERYTLLNSGHAGDGEG
jgi:bacterioferritin